MGTCQLQHSSKYRQGLRGGARAACHAGSTHVIPTFASTSLNQNCAPRAHCEGSTQLMRATHAMHCMTHPCRPEWGRPIQVDPKEVRVQLSNIHCLACNCREFQPWDSKLCTIAEQTARDTVCGTNYVGIPQSRDSVNHLATELCKTPAPHLEHSCIERHSAPASRISSSRQQHEQLSAHFCSMLSP